MKTTSAALLAAFLLLLTACGSSAGSDVNTSAEAGATAEAGDHETGSGDSGPAGDNTESADGTDNTESADGTHDTNGGASSGGVAGSTGTLNAALRAAGDPAAVTSARFETTITLIGAPGSEMPGEFSIEMAGAYDQAAEASQLSMDMSGLAELASSGDGGDELGFMAAFFEDDIEMITIGDRAWVRWSLLTMFTGADDMWLESDAGDTGELTSDFVVGSAPLPTDLFDLLADANVDVQEIGTEKVRGVDTVHTRFVADLETLALSMSDTEWEELESTLGAAPLGDMPIDLWLDEDGRLHRYVIDMSDLDAVTADDLAGLRIVFELWDHGADIGITPPPADEILTEDELTFGFGDTEEFLDLEG